MSEPAGIKFGHFTLGKRLARGGMAEVFLARQRGPEGFDRRVAVKRILPHLAEAPDFVRMFLSEARLAARLSHPNIVHIYELGQVDGDYFIAMEYVDGVHGGQLIAFAEREPIPPELVARIGADAAAALAYAHRLEDADGTPLSLVHRDVSPHNLMVSFDGVTKLVDFGIAKAKIKADETHPGVVKGKYAYMSPEQTTGRPLDGRSDVFSLGVCLWEMIAGRTIVDRGDVVEAMKVIRDGKWKPIEQVAPRVPAELARAISWALAHKRDARATAAQLQAALEAFIKSSPRLATPTDLAEWIRPRFGRTTGAVPVTGPGPTTAAIGTAMSAALPARPGTAQVAVTDAPLALGTETVNLTMADVEPVTPPPPRRPPRTPSARAPTHLDDEPSETTDLPTRHRGPSQPLTERPRRRAVGPVVVLAVALAIAVAVVIAGREPAAPGVSAPPDAAAMDAAPAAVAPSIPADAAPLDAALALDAAPPSPAILELITRPTGAQVKIGATTATAPATMAVAPGPVTVAISKDGYQPLTRTLTLAPGERRTLELSLDRKPSTQPRHELGYLTVRTTPYSIVTVGGRRLGETPFAGVEIAAGTHVLTFTNPTRKPVTRRVVVRPGKTVKLAFTIP